MECNCTTCGLTRRLGEVRTLTGTKQFGRLAKIRTILDDIDIIYNIHLDEDCERSMALAEYHD